MRLSPHFTLDEFTRSETASKYKLPNSPTEGEIKNLRLLANKVLEPIRELIGRPIQISSGYRGKELNTKIKGAANSQHCKGEAADIWVSGMTAKELYNKIKASTIEYDQLIYEQTSTATWVHISYKNNQNRKQKLLYIGGKYILDTK